MLEPCCVLGSGSSSMVRLVRFAPTRELFAVKSSTAHVNNNDDVRRQVRLAAAAASIPLRESHSFDSFAGENYVHRVAFGLD